MRSALVGHAQQVIIHGVGIRIDFYSFIELRDGLSILSPANVDQPQPTMSHSQILILRGGELFIGHVGWLRNCRRSLNRLF